jgi:uncharacterized protein (TIGR02466 family)
MIEDMFSIPLYRNKISISNEEHDFIINSKRIPNAFMNEVTEDKFILNNLQLSNLRSQCEYHFQRFANDVMSYDKCSLEITQSWANFNKQGSSHHTHSHPNSIVSAVLYLTDEPADLVMFKQTSGTVLLPELKETNKYNSLAYSVKLSKHDIVVFPSYLFHGVKLNTQETERVSVAINSFYIGELGTKEGSTYLRIQ